MDAATPQLHGIATLTPRELEVLHWVAEGKSNGDTGRIAGCCERTVKKHMQHIFAKLGVETRTASAILYVQAMAEAARSTLPGFGAGSLEADPNS